MKFNETVFEDLKLYDGLDGYAHKTDRIFKRYELNKGDYENSEKAVEFFRKAGWAQPARRDIITPFWRLFTAAIAFYSKEHEYKYGKWLTAAVEPTYILDSNNCLRYRTFYDKRDRLPGTHLSKAKIGLRYHEKNETLYENITKTMAYFPRLKDFSALSDSIANFSPCPEAPFNSLKGLLPDVCDFLNLMADKIRFAIDNQQNLIYTDAYGVRLEASYNQVCQWHEWLIANRKTYCLEEYYVVSEGRIKGISLFKNQSLANPLPKTKEAVEAALDNALRIITERGKKMSRLLIY